MATWHNPTDSKITLRVWRGNVPVVCTVEAGASVELEIPAAAVARLAPQLAQGPAKAPKAPEAPAPSEPVQEDAEGAPAEPEDSPPRRRRRKRKQTGTD